MKLTKTTAFEEFAMDMTPMIDVTFQLIIFFMLLMDMTQKELEELVLPKAVAAVEDKPDPTVVRPIVNILASGKILVKREVIYDPDADDGYAKLKEYLSRMASKMPTELLYENNPAAGRVPANPILIRADQATPFKHIQKVMEICGIKGIQIWKVQLAAGTFNDEEKEAAAAAKGGQ
jgi:biopolymer transport protein ExbD